MLRRTIRYLDANAVPFAIGVGTVIGCGLLYFASALWGAMPPLSHDLLGMSAALAKGGFLAVFLIAQQRLIGKSLSATTYVFPIALGFISLIEIFVFGTVLSGVSLVAMGILFAAGLAFTISGHVATMDVASKTNFAVMIGLATAFAVCDTMGLRRIGWLNYLFYTGVGNSIVALIIRKRISGIGWRHLTHVSAVWTIPELVFNYALNHVLPVAYGYFAIALRIPLLMGVSALLFGEGRLSQQLLFAMAALLGAALLFFGR